MAGNQHFQYINKLPYFKENLRKVKNSGYLRSQRTKDKGVRRDGGDELQNLIDRLFISVTKY